MMVQQLEHIARWINITELAYPARGRIRSDAIHVQIFRAVEEQIDPDNPPRGPVPTREEPWPEASEIRLEYEYKNGSWKQPAFKLKLHNTSDEPLYCALLYLSEMYGVSSELLPGGGVWLQPGEETWALNRKAIYASVPKEQAKKGVTESRDILKLLVSTAEFDATLLEQDELDRSHDRGTKSVAVSGRKSALNRLMQRTQFRALSSRSEEDEFYDDWISSQMSLITVRPLDMTPVSPEGREISLGAGVTLLPHPALQANVRFSTAPQAARDLGRLVLPPILKQEPDQTQPLQFTTSRGSDPGLSVLELSEIENYEAVTPQQPLQLHVDIPLAENEQVLPVGYDGEFFLPLGKVTSENGSMQIDLERLPAPVTQGSRDLKGATRILFQKVISQKRGKEFQYPLLAAAKVAEDGTVEYETDVEQVKERVAQADRILLYLHGLLGDTRDMAASARLTELKYDLVLTFDYESVQTHLEETAQELQKRLAAVGLGPQHGKTLDLVAHSTGGLVARWFIEREGGKQVVQHLVMTGTPNAGSPWPRSLQSWTTGTLGLALNALAEIFLPLKILNILISPLKNLDVMLKQIEPQSDFLKTLNSSEDPGVPYTILAGSTSIVSQAAESQAADIAGRIERLMERLSLKTLSHNVSALAFLKEPNDMFTSVESMKRLGESWSSQPEVQEIPCDYFSYFTTSPGQKALAEALTK